MGYKGNGRNCSLAAIDFLSDRSCDLTESLNINAKSRQGSPIINVLHYVRGFASYTAKEYLWVENLNKKINTLRRKHF